MDTGNAATSKRPPVVAAAVAVNDFVHNEAALSTQFLWAVLIWEIMCA